MATAPRDDNYELLQKELKELRDDLGSLVKTVRDIGTEQAGNMASKVRSAVGEVGERVQMTAADARRRGEIAAGEIEDMITRHPITSVMVAMGVGFVIGAFTRR